MDYFIPSRIVYTDVASNIAKVLYPIIWYAFVVAKTEPKKI